MRRACRNGCWARYAGPRGPVVWPADIPGRANGGPCGASGAARICAVRVAPMRGVSKAVAARSGVERGRSGARRRRRCRGRSGPARNHGPRQRGPACVASGRSGREGSLRPPAGVVRWRGVRSARGARCTAVLHRRSRGGAAVARGGVRPDSVTIRRGARDRAGRARRAAPGFDGCDPRSPAVRPVRALRSSAPLRPCASARPRCLPHRLLHAGSHQRTVADAPDHDIAARAEDIRQRRRGDLRSHRKHAQWR